LGRAVVGGLLSSTVLNLFVVPILYTMLNRDKSAEAHLLSSEPPLAGEKSVAIVSRT
jgi:hypothetical protein